MWRVEDGASSSSFIIMPWRDRESKRTYDRERKRNLTEEQREVERIRDRERYAERERRRRAREAPISPFTLIKHSSSSWIILYSALYYALTIITTPLARVFNEYKKKRKALRAVRELRCDGKRYRRLVLNFRCGLGNRVRVRVPNPGALAPYTTAELQPQIPLVPRAATGRGVGSNPQSPAQQGLVRGIGGLSLVRSSALRAMAAHHNMRTSSTAAFVQEFL